MENIEYSINEGLSLPKGFIIHPIDNEFLIIDKKCPNWISITSDELILLSCLEDNSTLLESLEHLHGSTGYSEEICLSTLQSLLKKISENNFLLANKGEDEELIGDIKKNIHLEITSNCNIRCKHCYMSAGKVNMNQLAYDDIVSFIESLDLNRVSKDIVVTGGEPLLHQDFDKIVTYLKSKSFKIILFTNGLLINAANIESINNFVDSVQISLEGISSDSFEYVRGKNTYNKFKKTVAILKQYNLKTTFAITVLDDTLADLEKNLITFLQELDYDNIEIRLNDDLEKKGYAVALGENNFSNIKENKKRVAKIIQSLVQHGFYHESTAGKCKRFTNCGIGAAIVVSSDGNIYPCNEYNQQTTHNIAVKSSYLNIINDFDDLNRSTSINNIAKCKVCDIKYLCSGGCRVKSLNENGSMLDSICNKEETFFKIHTVNV